MKAVSTKGGEFNSWPSKSKAATNTITSRAST